MINSAKVIPQANAVFLVKGDVESPVLSGSTISPHIYQAFPPDNSLFPASANPQIWGILGTNWGKIRGRRACIRFIRLIGLLAISIVQSKFLVAFLKTDVFHG